MLKPTERYARRPFLKLSRAELNMFINYAVANKQPALAEALQDVMTFKRDRNREARRRFGA